MIKLSPRGKDLASRAVADTFAARLADFYPLATLVRRDLAAEHLPHLDDITLQAISGSSVKKLARRSGRVLTLRKGSKPAPRAENPFL